jgi:hypothetical protein
MILRRCFSLVCLLVLLYWGASAPGSELVHLANGGRIQGEVLNPDEIPRATYRIRTPAGEVIVVAKDQVVKVVHQTEAEDEYNRIRPLYPDTAEGQMELSNWCREHRLGDARDLHLKRVIELDPDHAEARRGLGYMNREGHWVTTADLNEKRGLRLYKGRWLTPEAIEIKERNRKQELAEKGWMSRIRRWRDWLDTSRAAEAKLSLLSIDDPAAVRGLKYYYSEEEVEEIRAIFVEALGGIQSNDAFFYLAKIALNDTDEETRLTALDFLVEKPNAAVSDLFVDALKSDDPAMINRAAVALARMEYHRAIGPLVNSLVTVHKRTRTSGSPNGFNTTFGSGGGGGPGGLPVSGGGGGGISVGTKTETIRFESKNSDVLDALIRLTGVNYQYDLAAWKAWLATHAQPESLDARRD